MNYRLFIRSFIAWITILVFTPAFANSEVTARTAEQWMQAFGVPADDAPFQIDAMIAGSHVKLEWPADQDILNHYAPAVQSEIRRRAALRRENLAVLRKTFYEVEQLLHKRHPRLVEGYEADMSRVAISLIDDQAFPGNSLARHEPFLRALPGYTVIDLFLPAALEHQVTQRLAQLKIANTVTLHPITNQVSLLDGRDVTSTRWAHDLALIGVDDAYRRFVILPLTYSQADDLSRPDDNFVLQLTGIEFFRTPLFVRAGNLITARANGKRLLLIGERELDLIGAYYYNSFFFMPQRTAVVDLLRSIGGVDDVVTLPNSVHLFHIDMVVAAIRPGAIALQQPLDIENVAPRDRAVLEQTRAILMDWGFSVIDIPTSAARIEHYQSPVNVLVFNDLDEGEKTVMVPHFADSAALPNSSADLDELVDAAYRVAGLRVLVINDLFHQGHGNLHCTVMMLH